MKPRPAPFVIPDFRSHDGAMTPLPLKLPAFAVDQLRRNADRMGCTRSALARALLVRGLAELDCPEQMPVVIEGADR
jgi:hypothetical protein